MNDFQWVAVVFLVAAVVHALHSVAHRISAAIDRQTAVQKEGDDTYFRILRNQDDGG
jgi:hypothetical protein